MTGTGTPPAILDKSDSIAALSFTANLMNLTHLGSKPTADQNTQWAQAAGIFISTDRPESAKC